MALLKIKTVMERLGYKSPQSIYNLKKRGHLTIVHLPPSGKSRSKIGAPRIASEDVERLEQLVASGQEVKPVNELPKPRLSSSREASRPRPVVAHFE